MSSTYVKPASVGQITSPPRRRAGLVDVAAVVAGVTAVGAALAIFLAPTEAPSVAAPAVVDEQPAVATSPIEGYAVEGTQGYEWRIRSATDGYTVVEGPFGYEVVRRE